MTCKRSGEPTDNLQLPGENSFDDWAIIVDCGDAPLTFLDNTVALKQLEKAHKVCVVITMSTWLPLLSGAGGSAVLDANSVQVTSGRAAATTSKSSIPRIITLGGDHTTTLAALRSTHAHWGEVSVIHFDSHIGRL